MCHSVVNHRMKAVMTSHCAVTSVSYKMVVMVINGVSLNSSLVNGVGL